MKFYIYSKITFAILYIFIFLPKSVSQNQEINAKEFYTKGLSEYNDGKYEQAIKDLKESIKNQPRAITYYMLMNSYSRKGDYHNTIAYSDSISKLRPPLDPKYLPGVEKLVGWANDTKQKFSKSTQLTAHADVYVPPFKENVLIPSESENSFSSYNPETTPGDSPSQPSQKTFSKHPHHNGVKLKHSDD